MAFFPLPNFQQIANQSFVNNYAANGAVAIHGNSYNTREDYYVNPKNTIFGRYSYQGFTEDAPGVFGLEAGGPAFGNYAGSSVASNQSVAIGWTNTISSTLINEFRFGWMRYHVFDVPNGFGTSPALSMMPWKSCTSTSSGLRLPRLMRAFTSNSAPTRMASLPSASMFST